MRDNGQSVILVDGQFSQDETITVTQRDISDVPLDNITECWLISMPDDGAEQHTIRFQPLNGNPKNTTVYLYSEEQWSEVDTETMGRYLLLSVDGMEVQLAIESPKGSSMLFVAIGIGVVLLAFALGSLHLVKSKREKE